MSDKSVSEKQLAYAKSISQKVGKELPRDMSYESLNAYIQKNLSDYKRLQSEDKKQELRDKIVSEISIVSYAEELGFTVIRKGRYFSLKEHDSVIIDPDRNCYWRNSESGRGSSIGKGDSVIGFADNFSNRTMHEILSDFTERVKGITTPTRTMAASTVKEKGELVLPDKAANMRNVYAYLIKSRYIDTSVVQDFVDKKMLYQDAKNNCIFVSYEENKPVFACKRGTNTERRFLADVENSNYEKGFYIDNHSDKLIVTESVIDAMSVMTVLKAKGLDYKEYDYQPLAGAAKFDALRNRLQQQPKKELFLALDNDKGGVGNTEAIEKLLEENDISIFTHRSFPASKDWNQEIRDAFNKGKAIADIDFFQNTDFAIAEEAKKKEKNSFVQKACNKAEKVVNDLPGKKNNIDFKSEIQNEEELEI